MNDVVKERWSKSFLDQEEAVENLARMASVAEKLCFATFGEVAASDKDWEDALFAIRHLAAMIDTFQREYLAAIREDSCISSSTAAANISAHNETEHAPQYNRGLKGHCETHSLSAPLDKRETDDGSVIAIPRVIKCDSLA